MTVSSTAPALVLIPGLVSDATVWRHQVAAFRNRRPLVIDHGELDSLVDMAHAVLRQAPDSFALAGHSMGGRVALEVVRLAPERVERLALLDTGYEPLASGPDGEREIAGRKALLDLGRQHGMRAMGMEWSRRMVHPDRLNDRDLMNEIYDMIARKTPEQFAAQIRALLARPSANDVLASLRCPTLILCGREDSWAPWARHVDMAGRVEDSVLVGVQHCGHMAPMERPDAVNAALTAWLED